MLEARRRPNASPSQAPSPSPPARLSPPEIMGQPFSTATRKLVLPQGAGSPHPTAPSRAPPPTVFLPYVMPFKAKTLQITWHAKAGSKNDPLLSIDFHPTLPLFATAGGDNEIKVWRLHELAAAEPSVEYAFTLTGHMKTVNTVRFSPNGDCLASVSDGAWRRAAPLGRRARRASLSALVAPPPLPLSRISHSRAARQTPCAPFGAPCPAPRGPRCSRTSTLRACTCGEYRGARARGRARRLDPNPPLPCAPLPPRAGATRTTCTTCRGRPTRATS
jgi:hypothetical protein